MFILNILINLSETIYFPLLCVGEISISFSYNHEFVDLSLSTNMLFGLRPVPFKLFCKALVIMILFYFSKE